MKKSSLFPCSGYFIFLSVLFFGCKKSSSPAPAGPPEIITLSPLEGPGGTTVTISGMGFGASLNQDSVFFNGKNAVIVKATDTQLVVKVPSLAGTGNVSIKVGGIEAIGLSFTYDYQYAVSTYAGSGTAGSTDATGAAASFRLPYGVTAVGNDANTDIYVYVADFGNDKIRLIAPGGVVSTLAGSGVQGSKDSTGTGASFGGPTTIAADGKGNLYIADYLNNKIRMINAAGVVSSFAGTGNIGSINASIALDATFSDPIGVALDGSGNLFVTDQGNNLIRMISVGGVVTTLAGSGGAGSTDATGLNASFFLPTGIAMDPKSGNLYVADFDANKIRMITAGGVVTTLAGSGSAASIDGTGTAASFNGPTSIAIDGNENLYVTDQNGNTIRMITAGGVVTTIAGSGNAGSTDAVGAAASFHTPSGITADRNGNLYVADYSNDKIRKIILQ